MTPFFWRDSSTRIFSVAWWILAVGRCRAFSVFPVSLGAALNPDDANRPYSVAVRVYQLKDRKRFDAASYDDLLKDDQTVLAEDLQASIATVVNPGAAASVSQPMRRDTQYVAVVAFYRKPDANGTWRRVVQRKHLSADAPLKFDLVENELLASAGVPAERPAR
ncbi:UNVERIFIED_ORG: type VI secretion system protein VasD [Burkholderia sp. 1595]|uniref:Type VI secretion system protein VasD n=1 Tax=Paraburkholderia terricola TaxID=169427 RepID=A0ABU1LUS7_9BURK|nr:type VI secretion system protein VasD [Paraburkholderia terricola]MDR6481076.1 type VI secretion system protein VasD [Paraburkholderia terricola]